MRKNRERKDMQVYCNCCGRQIKSQNGIMLEGVVPVMVEWGYFSSKDGEINKFDLCEMCYNEIVSRFLIPVEVVSKKEFI